MDEDVETAWLKLLNEIKEFGEVEITVCCCETCNQEV